MDSSTKDIGIDAAIDALTLVDERFARVTLQESRAAADAGCPSQPGVLVVSGAALGSEIVTGTGSAATANPGTDPVSVPIDTSRLTGGRVCLYGPATGAASGPGFLSTRALTLEQTRAIADAASRAPATPACVGSASRFAVLHLSTAAPPAPSGGGAESAITVPGSTIALELDGCGRLVDTSLRALVAPPEIIRLLTP